ncbi:CGNR zinc finger domain-containing protein [Actinoallomurus sp. NPDC050550]|uniref:CGNR zinc finger domain-containing protein n=1 Tax=Actinoallomurus sp. NPDC050550 TaxID=3154937 RepID=UPI0033EE9964
MDSSATPGLVLRTHSGAVFRFDPGALCLELLTTGGPGEGRRWEVLHEPADLAAWAARSRLPPTPALEIAPQEVTDARRLRDALWRIAIARTRDEPCAPEDLATVNEAAAHPPLAPAIGADGERRWAGPADGARLLATVAHDAVDLLTGPFAERIRTCAGDNCYLIYVDTSRPGRRRWCSMEHCGNRQKVRALRARRSTEHRPDVSRESE